jgi:hypothetical protein
MKARSAKASRTAEDGHREGGLPPPTTRAPARTLLYGAGMPKKSLVSGVAIILLAQIGTSLTSCVGPTGIAGTGGAAEVGGAASAPAGGSSNSGGTSGSSMGGGSVGGSIVGGGVGGFPLTSELCGIWVLNECEDGVVDVMFGIWCSRVTIKCPGECRDEPKPTTGSSLTLKDVEESVCEPLNMGGAAEAGRHLRKLAFA